MLENRRNPLTAADTHRDQRTLASGPGQLIERFDRQDRAGGSKGVAQRDTAPVGIGALRRQFEFPANGQGLGGKGFVDLL